MNIFNEHGFLSLFKSRKKPNLTPDIPFPTQEQLYFTPQLRQFAEDRISGKNVGFGDEFVDRASNPAVQSREARFREYEMPQLSSQLSSRGLARSIGPNLASDVITRAGQAKERDINELLANFYTLNEQQKKADITQGVDLGKYMQTQQAGMKADQALASERLSKRTAEQQNQYQSEDRAGLDKLGAMILAGASGGMAGGFGGAGGFSGLPIHSAGASSINDALLKVMGGSGSRFSLPGFVSGALGGASGRTAQQILGSEDYSLLKTLIARGIPR